MENKSDKTNRIDLPLAEPENKESRLEPCAPNENQSPSRSWIQSPASRNTFFYKLLECAYDAVLITSREGCILECNKRALSFFAAEYSRLNHLNIFSLISNAPKNLIETINGNLRSDQYTLLQARCIRLDGTSFPAEIAVNEVDLDSAGELFFMVRDISVRIRRQNELQDAVERLQAHDRARMEFVSNVSHELRTPLTSMIYAVNNMLRGVVGPMQDKAVHYLERLQSDCHRLLGTVNDILDLRQIENKTLVLTRAVVPMGPIIRDAVESLRVQAEAKSIALTYSPSDQELFSYCDVQKIERVMLNVIGNAIKFTPPGGKISVKLSLYPRRPKYLLITVSDTGMGVPKELLPKISQRYFRVGDHVTGSGLGLAISKEIVELHNGQIRFESPVPGTNCGTAVSISLLLAKKPRVVIYSETPDVGSEMRELVDHLGYRVEVIQNMQRLLSDCLSKPLSVLIIDRTSEKVDARNLILSLRENPKTKRLPVIVFGKKEVRRADIDLYRHFGVFYTMYPVEDETFAQNLALAVLGKLR